MKKLLTIMFYDFLIAGGFYYLLYKLEKWLFNEKED